MISRVLLSTIFVMISLFLQGQIKVGFEEYQLRSFQLSDKELEKGFGNYIFKKQQVDSFSLAHLKYRSSRSEKGVFRRSFSDKIAFMIHNTMTIDSTGCYKIELSSDDGSRFWIDSALLINNDFPHGMRTKTRELCIPRGEYPIDIWYYNAYPLNYGLVFKVEWYGESSLCEEHIHDFKSEKKMRFQDVVFFDFDRYIIRQDAMDKLDSIAQIINAFDAEYVEIHGHTDQLGDDTYNMRLSEKRATAIRQALQTRVFKSLEWKAIGHGERALLTEKTDKVSRQKNRRVEIRIRSMGAL